MFRLIQLQNFQSHEDSTLELDPGVNIIIGPSDSGKTAIIRALRWLRWNRPGGDSFRSSWGGDTIVSVDVDDMRIKRIREDKYNAYVIITPEKQEGFEYVAFGADPPEDVVVELNLDAINLQQQLDRPFLLDSSPGQVAQYLNEVASLDVIDRALQKLGKWTRDVEADIRTHAQNQERLEASLSSFDYLPEMEEYVERLEALEAELVSLRTLQKNLTCDLTTLGTVEERLSELRALREIGPFVDSAFQLSKEIDGLRSEGQQLESILNRLDEVESQMSVIQPLHDLAPDVDKALTLTKELSEVQSKSHRLAGLLGRYDQLVSSISKAKKERDRLSKEFDEGMGDRCQLCGAERVAPA